MVLTNCLSETPDEGCLRVANSIIKRLKKSSSEVTVVSYERKSSCTDVFVRSNKLLLTKDIIRTVRKSGEDILYVPFPARSSATALRIMLLSFFSGKKVKVLLSQVTEAGLPAKLFLSLCKAEILVLSDDTKQRFERILNGRRIRKINAGVDTERFVPVTEDEAQRLKSKYGFATDKPIVLHVGHMNEGRNISQLIKLSEKYCVVLVTSSFTKDEQDVQLKEKLSQCADLYMIDDYLPDIHEIYQLADVYFFPVVQEGNCIDVPLSCLEAASCNIPVVTTDFGEMKSFRGKEGFWFIESFEAEEINRLVERAAACKNVSPRRAVIDYDWNKAINSILNA